MMANQIAETPVKLELSLVASHKSKEVIEQFCKAINVKPTWIKEKKQGEYYMARIWFKRRLPADFVELLKDES